MLLNNNKFLTGMTGMTAFFLTLENNKNIFSSRLEIKNGYLHFQWRELFILFSSIKKNAVRAVKAVSTSTTLINGDLTNDN